MAGGAGHERIQINLRPYETSQGRVAGVVVWLDELDELLVRTTICESEEFAWDYEGDGGRGDGEGFVGFEVGVCDRTREGEDFVLLSKQKIMVRLGVFINSSEIPLSLEVSRR